MGSIGMTFSKHTTKDEVLQVFSDTVDYEVPHRFADLQKCLFVGTVNSIEKARQLLNEKQKTKLDSGMVYCKVVTKAIPKTTSDVLKRKENEEKKLAEYIANNNCYDRKSATIGCKECGSSLSTSRMAQKKLNKCPLCGKDLRSDTVLKTINGYKQNIRKYEKQYEGLTAKARGKDIFYCSQGEFYVG